MTERPLIGRTIVVTRAAEQSAELSSEIVAAGGTSLLLPLLEIVDPPDPTALAAEVDGLAPDDWLVVTSTNGALRVLQGFVAHDRRPKLAVVGPTTAQTFRKAGWTPDLVPSVANAETLVGEFPQPPTDASARVLVAQGDLARSTVADGLRTAGWTLSTEVAYCNIAPEVDSRTAAAALQADAVVFASPTAVNRYVDLVGVSPRLAGCIGSVTADAAIRREFDVVVADTTSAGDLVAAVADRLASG